MDKDQILLEEAYGRVHTPGVKKQPKIYPNVWGYLRLKNGKEMNLEGSPIKPFNPNDIESFGLDEIGVGEAGNYIEFPDGKDLGLFSTYAHKKFYGQLFGVPIQPIPVDITQLQRAGARMYEYIGGDRFNNDNSRDHREDIFKLAQELEASNGVLLAFRHAIENSTDNKSFVNKLLEIAANEAQGEVQQELVSAILDIGT